MSDTYFSADEERSLIRQAQDGETGARNALLLASQPRIRAALRRLIPYLRRVDEEEIVQESMAILCDRLPHYDLAHPARARLYVFAWGQIRKFAYSHLTEAIRYQNADPEPVVQSSSDPVQAAERQQYRSQLSLALSTLTSKEQDVLMHRTLSDDPQSFRLIADRYQCTPQALMYVEKQAGQKLFRALPRISQIELSSQ